MDDDRALYLSKAQESLASAESDFLSERYNSCANRCYYACFQAAIAALLREGIRPVGNWGHDFVEAQFVGQLIHRRKRYDAVFRYTLADNRQLRQVADYDTKFVIQIRAKRTLARSQAFVSAVAEREPR